MLIINAGESERIQSVLQPKVIDRVKQKQFHITLGMLGMIPHFSLLIYSALSLLTNPDDLSGSGDLTVGDFLIYVPLIIFWIIGNVVASKYQVEYTSSFKLFVTNYRIVLQNQRSEGVGISEVDIPLKKLKSMVSSEAIKNKIQQMNYSRYFNGGNMALLSPELLFLLVPYILMNQSEDPSVLSLITIPIMLFLVGSILLLTAMEKPAALIGRTITFLNYGRYIIEIPPKMWKNIEFSPEDDNQYLKSIQNGLKNYYPFRNQYPLFNSPLGVPLNIGKMVGDNSNCFTQLTDFMNSTDDGLQCSYGENFGKSNLSTKIGSFFMCAIAEVSALISILILNAFHIEMKGAFDLLVLGYIPPDNRMSWVANTLFLDIIQILLVIKLVVFFICVIVLGFAYTSKKVPGFIENSFLTNQIYRGFTFLLVISPLFVIPADIASVLNSSSIFFDAVYIVMLLLFGSSITSYIRKKTTFVTKVVDRTFNISRSGFGIKDNPKRGWAALTDININQQLADSFISFTAMDAINKFQFKTTSVKEETKKSFIKGMITPIFILFSALAIIIRWNFTTVLGWSILAIVVWFSIQFSGLNIFLYIIELHEPDISFAFNDMDHFVIANENASSSINWCQHIRSFIVDFRFPSKNDGQAYSEGGSSPVADPVSDVSDLDGVGVGPGAASDSGVSDLDGAGVGPGAASDSGVSDLDGVGVGPGADSDSDVSDLDGVGVGPSADSDSNVSNLDGWDSPAASDSNDSGSDDVGFDDGDKIEWDSSKTRKRFSN